jgi:hypothetical protein
LLRHTASTIATGSAIARIAARATIAGRKPGCTARATIAACSAGATIAAIAARVVGRTGPAGTTVARIAAIAAVATAGAHAGHTGPTGEPAEGAAAAIATRAAIAAVAAIFTGPERARVAGAAVAPITEMPANVGIVLRLTAIVSVAGSIVTPGIGAAAESLPALAAVIVSTPAFVA